RDETDARDRVPQARNHLVDFVSGKLSALSGFGALGHLDLQFVRIYQVVGGNAEAGRGNLLHRAAPGVSSYVAQEAVFVLSAFSCVRLSADAVHRDSQRLV